MLNLARSLGDNAMKKLDMGLISKPYISPVFEVKSNSIVLIASDGLWDIFSVDEVVKIVMHNGFSNMDILLSTLFKHAIDRGIMDDITMTAIKFKCQT